jgi:putative ATPase
MPDRRYYHPVPRGLELKIGEKLQELARKNRDRKNVADSSDRDDSKK